MFFLPYLAIAQVIFNDHLYFKSKTDEDSNKVCHFVYTQYFE